MTNKQLLKSNSGSKAFFANRGLKLGMMSGWPECSVTWRPRESASSAEVNGTAEDLFTY